MAKRHAGATTALRVLIRTPGRPTCSTRPTTFSLPMAPTKSRTETVIDIFNNTSGSGVGKTDWLVNLNAPDFNQYGGTITTPFNLTMTNPNGSGTIYYTLDGTDPRAPGGALSASAIAYTGTISLDRVDSCKSARARHGPVRHGERLECRGRQDFQQRRTLVAPDCRTHVQSR